MKKLTIALLGIALGTTTQALRIETNEQVKKFGPKVQKLVEEFKAHAGQLGTPDEQLKDPNTAAFHHTEIAKILKRLHNLKTVS